MLTIIASLVIVTNAFNVVTIRTDSPTNGICNVREETPPTLVTSVSFNVGRYDSGDFIECELGRSRSVRYSKLKIIVASKKRGKWDDIKSFILGAKCEDEWLAAQYITSGYKQFDDACEAVISSGIVTREELDEILAESIDEEVL